MYLRRKLKPAKKSSRRNSNERKEEQGDKSQVAKSKALGTSSSGGGNRTRGGGGAGGTDFVCNKNHLYIYFLFCPNRSLVHPVTFYVFRLQILRDLTQTVEDILRGYRL